MWKEKLGNYLIDVSKYFLTGVFVASLVKDLEETRWLIYALSGSVAAILLLLGLILTNKKDIKCPFCYKFISLTIINYLSLNFFISVNTKLAKFTFLVSCKYACK